MDNEPTLNRILDPDADIIETPTTLKEQHFVLSVINHLAAVQTAIAEGAYRESEGMKKDIESFFSLPIPRSVAQSVLEYQPSEFQDFLIRHVGWQSAPESRIVSPSPLGEEVTPAREEH